MSAAPPLRVSVVLATYTAERLAHLRDGLTALGAQTRMPDEVLLVVDNNPAMVELARRELADLTTGEGGSGPALRVLPHTGSRGCGAARNTGAAASTGDVIVFLDDDATPAPEWLAELLAPLADPGVAVTGSHATPAFTDSGRPAWFPSEFNWTVGAHHDGVPQVASDVRNVWGVAMAVRAEDFAACGGFDRRFGRVGTDPLGGEETELCIRVRRGSRGRGGRRVVFAPASRVRHHVPASRLTWRYFLSRCHAEGVSKALISSTVGVGDSLSDETRYVTHQLPRAAARGLLEAWRGDLTGLSRTAAIVAGLTATVSGYVRGTAGGRS